MSVCAFLYSALWEWVAFLLWLTSSEVAKDRYWQLPNKSSSPSSTVLSGLGIYSCGSGKDSQIPSLPKIFVPIFPHFFLQVFQKCSVKDVVVKNLVEPTARIEPQIRELRPGALLALKEKKVKYISPCSCPANRLPLPTIWYNQRLCLTHSTTFVHLLWLERETYNKLLPKPFFPCCLIFISSFDSAGHHSSYVFRIKSA